MKVRKKLRLKKRIILFSGLLAVVAAGLALECNLKYPNHINIFEGELLNLRSSSPYTIDAPANFGGVLEEDGSVGADDAYVKADKTGSYEVNLKLFGIIPVRTVEVNVQPQREIVPCGSTIGIKIFTQGLVCVGTSEIKGIDGRTVNLGIDYDIRVADILLSVNGLPLESTEQLAQIVSGSNGDKLVFEIERDGKNLTKELIPVNTKEGYKLGVWVRDSTAGIGTLTFYDKATHQYGALGHPITDADTGALMPVSKGTILNASIFNLKKGEKGTPGELKGIFQSNKTDLGTIEKNTNQGIYGVLNPENLPNEGHSYPAASKNQVKEGKATILSNIHDERVEEFEIEIQKVIKYNTINYKDMVIKVTDERLLEQAGGIVQGMSGSPILQDGKVVGAVTHVFVNDPSRGYGVFIDNMLDNLS